MLGPISYKWLKNIFVPNLYLSEKVVNMTMSKYIGMFIMDTMKDDMAIKRQIKCIYTRGNILIKKFRQCDDCKKLIVQIILQ